MKAKQIKIQEWMKLPPVKGDLVDLILPKETKKRTATIVKDNQDGTFEVKGEGIYGEEGKKIPLSIITKIPINVGVNPFYEEIGRVRFTNYSIEGILGWYVDWRESKLREDKREYQERGVPIIEYNFNPYIIDNDGKIVHYQRPLVWTLEEKQLLIESVYMNMDIGKVIVRKKSWAQIAKDVDRGEEPAFRDVVDGKQRLSTLASFMLGEFPDVHGNFFYDLTDSAQRRFANYQGLSFGEMDEDATDAQAIATFLRVNFAGVPQSKEHIEFVKSINIK